MNELEREMGLRAVLPVFGVKEVHVDFLVISTCPLAVSCLSNIRFLTNGIVESGPWFI